MVVRSSSGDLTLDGEDIANVEGLLNELRKLKSNTEYPVVLQREEEKLSFTISLEPR